MKPSIQFTKSPFRRRLIPLVFACFAPLPMTQGVFPPPEGGYAGGNTALGASALLSLTTGTFNTATGLFSLVNNTEGEFNTAIGAGTLLGNTADQNTATGVGALLTNMSGAENTANGAFALFSNTSGFGNTAVGSNALFSNTTGGTLGTTQGVDVGPNTAIGMGALASNTISSANTAVGYQALGTVITGFDGTDVGASTAVGFQALANATGEAFNEAFGYRALLKNTEGGNNVAIGHHALLNNTTGGENAAIGDFALSNNTTGFGNTALGIQAGTNVTTAQDVICIGTPGENVNSSCFIGNIFGTTIGGGMTSVFIDSSGQLGTISSSRQFKREIKPMGKASEAILALKPVTFHYKTDNTNTPQFGLIAEEVADVNPDLVVRDKNGEIYTVRYEAVNAMLLNEFLKEYKKVEAQESSIENHQATIAGLKSTVARQQKNFAQQEAKIQLLTSGLQKVRAQIEMGNPTRKVVQNP